MGSGYASYLIGVDGGTESIRAGVFNLKGIVFNLKGHQSRSQQYNTDADMFSSSPL